MSKMDDIKSAIKEYDSYENDNYRIGAMAQTILSLRQKLNLINDKAVFDNLKKYDVTSSGWMYDADCVDELLGDIANLSIHPQSLNVNEYRFLNRTDIVRETDQAKYADGSWKSVSYLSVGGFISQEQEEAKNYRRKYCDEL